MTYHPDCPHCALEQAKERHPAGKGLSTSDREEDALRISERHHGSQEIDAGSRSASASGPAIKAGTSPLPDDFGSLSRSERVSLLVDWPNIGEQGPVTDEVLRGPFCIAGCGRPVPVHGETCDWCWR